MRFFGNGKHKARPAPKPDPVKGLIVLWETKVKPEVMLEIDKLGPNDQVLAEGILATVEMRIVAQAVLQAMPQPPLKTSQAIIESSRN
jgi:hypothetical protein